MARFDRGWIKLHRTVIEGDIGKNAYCLALFVRLLCWANLRPSTVRFNGQPREIPRGSLVIGVRDLAEKIGCSKETAYRQLIYLEKRDTIRREVGTEGSLITIVNFERYQAKDDEAEREPNADETVTKREVGHEPTPIEEEKKKRKRIVASSATTQLWDYYSKELAKKGIKAVHQGAKTNKLAKTLLDRHGQGTLPLVDSFLSDQDRFVRDQAWSLGLLVSQDQKYAARMKNRGLGRGALKFGEEEDAHAADVRPA